MSDMSCDHVHEQIAELALGVLEGRDRAAVLAHVERCPLCQDELIALGVVADQLVTLTPAAEPPAGFETRVLARLSEAPPPPARRRPGRRLVLEVAVAAALAAVLAVGGWAIGRHSATVGRLAGGTSRDVMSATFLAGGHVVGQVLAYDGDDPWVAMAVDGDLGNRTVRCELVQRSGATWTVGTVTLHDGYGYWEAPVGPSLSSVTGVELVDAAGQRLATATFPSSSD